MNRSERWVLLGLARGRAGWFREVSQWATSAALAAEFVKCVSVEEVRARLASGRRHSALLIDARAAGVDRDLFGAAADAATPVLAIGDAGAGRLDAVAAGAAAVLPPDFDLATLIDALVAHARTVDRADTLPPLLGDDPLPRWRGRLVTVCGPGGTGTSTVAAALAQGCAADPRYSRRVVLADLARRAEQALLHEAPDIGPGLLELVEAHRRGRPGPSEVEALTFDVPARGYALLLGLRQASAWSALRPRATDAALDGLRQTFQIVVADVTGDVEGEADGGSMDVEERNHLARTTAGAADVVVAVGLPGIKGVHSLGVVIRDLVALGVAPHRILPVINRAPRHPRLRAEAAGALATATATAALPTGTVFLPEAKVELAFRDGTALPAALVVPLAPAVHAVMARVADEPPADRLPDRVAPGSLGHWSDPEGIAP